MRFDYRFQAVLTGALASAAIVMAMPQVATAHSVSEIRRIAREITVSIDGERLGSGVIIGRDENTYYVLTTKHVVEAGEEYTVETPDGERYQLDYNNVKKLPGVDLAVLEFNSDLNYRVAKLADPNQTNIGERVYIAGFTARNVEENLEQRRYKFISERISGQRWYELGDGAALIYTNEAFPGREPMGTRGMSGGPILDDDGYLVGIHGRKDGVVPLGNNPGMSTTIQISGFNLGIPIQAFVKLALNIGINWGGQVENTDSVEQPMRERVRVREIPPPPASYSPLRRGEPEERETNDDIVIPEPPVEQARILNNFPTPTGTSFGQQEVDQNNFIAVASPYNVHRYQLLILEQKSNQRACWNESGTNPTIVDPLLTQFDFTGICGRSVDSNGYSVRLAGQDLGWRGDLNIVRRGSELVLVATSSTNPNALPLEIGRSNGISSTGFIKIFLNPDWRFAKRTYQNKETEHVYLTNDRLDTGFLR